MPLRLGVGVKPVGGYTLIRKLGQGGFGEAWEALAPGGVHVALKFIRLDCEQAGLEIRALEIIRNVRHAHLLDVQFSVQVEDCLVIAMPLCDQSLWDRFQECRGHDEPGIPRDELLEYMEDLAKAVDFLNEPRHRMSDGTLVCIQHRDIKPHNIFLVGGSVRLADFGLAKVLESNAVSHTGSMSPQYAAPECFHGTISTQTDQYSLAVAYCQLRSGRLPFTGSVNQVVYGHLAGEPDLSGLPEAERAVIARALAKKPDDRWPTCQAFVHHLKEAARAEAGAPTAVDTDAETVAFLGAKLGVAMAGQAGPSRPPGPPLDPGSNGVDTSAETLAVVPENPGSGAANRAGLVAAPGAANDRPQPLLDADTDPVGPGTDPGRRRRWPVLAGLGGLVAVAACLIVVAGPLAKKRLVPSPRSTAISIPPLRGSGFKVRREPREPAAAAVDRRAYGVFKKYCYRCHGINFDVAGFNVLDRRSLLARRGAGAHPEEPYVVPGKPDESSLWRRVGVRGDMPPKDDPQRPSPEETALLKRWIEAGAPFPAGPEKRPFQGEREVLTAIRDHLRRTPAAARRYQRYFTLTNLYNNHPNVTEDELRLGRAAVAKLINSLSWQPAIVVPGVIDRTGAILNVDLRSLGWDTPGLWEQLLKAYPYGIRHNHDQDPDLRRLAQEVLDLSGSDLPYLRADWFVATASRPPLYYAFIKPGQGCDLEAKLGVDVEADFLHNKLARSGFTRSGVSSQNRMVDRHPATSGAYWKTYDFRPNQDRSNLFKYPLGPMFLGNPFLPDAFAPAGSEIIFSLPNGLQGYLIVDAAGQRIDTAPVEIVADSLKTAGTPVIVAGLSCMGCHSQGMKRFTDEIRSGTAVHGDARAKVEALIAPPAVMDQRVEADARRFLDAVDQAAGRFLKVGDDAGKDIREFAEPIGALARIYLKDLGPEEVACELGIRDVQELQARIRSSPELRESGLEPLLAGNRIKRQAWLVPFRKAVRELDRGAVYIRY